MTEIEISSRPLSLADLRRIWNGPVKLSLSDEACDSIRASQATVDAVIKGGEQVYGINTGFGLLANVRISDDELGVLQENLICSHAVGVGPLLPQNGPRPGRWASRRRPARSSWSGLAATSR